MIRPMVFLVEVCLMTSRYICLWCIFHDFLMHKVVVSYLLHLDCTSFCYQSSSVDAYYNLWVNHNDHSNVLFYSNST